jgi:hypothetical protein
MIFSRCRVIVNAQLAGFKELKKSALKRALQEYLSADHNPAAPENRARPDFGIIYEAPDRDEAAATRGPAKFIGRNKTAQLESDVRRGKHHLSNSQIVSRRVA